MRRDRSLFLALDQGGHATRAIVFDSNGATVVAAEKSIRTRRIGVTRVEHDPAALIASLRSVCRAVARQLGTQAAHIRCAGLATQRSTIACWNRETGRALAPVISWQDRRAARRVQAVAKYASQVHRITGLVLSPHYGASKLAWCLRNVPAVRRALREQRLAAGPLASFILTNLLEEKPLLADPVNASRTLLWDYRTREWSKALLNLFGVPGEILPACVANRHAFGHLRLGLYEVPLAVVTGDQPAALFANGPPVRDNVYINLGTGAFIQRLHGTRPPQARGLLGSVLWQDQQRVQYVLEGTVNGAGSALDWLCSRLGVTEQQMLKHMPDWLDRRDGIPLFLNGVAGLGSPWWQPGFRSRFVGRGATAEKFAAAVESIVFLLCANLERMQRPGAPARRIVVSGGLARWSGLCQRLADLSRLIVLRPEQHEGTARGLAVLLGMRAPHAAPSQQWAPQFNNALQTRYADWRHEMHRALKRAG